MIELYWILAGTLALSGIMLGVYRSLWQVCGYSNTYLFGDPESSSRLGILPTAVIQTGLFVFLSLTLRVTSILFKNQDILSSIGIATGFGLILSLQLTVIRHMSQNLHQFLLIGLSDAVIGAIAGGIFKGNPDIIDGGILGAIIGLFEILLRMTRILPGSSDEKRADLFPFWIVAWIGGNIGFGFAVFVKVIIVIMLLLAFMVNYVVPLLVHFIGKIVSPLVSPMLILFRFKIILCNHCFRYTSPLRSHYNCGRRYCEHCQKQVEYTHDPGLLIVTFGDALPALEGRAFIFTNPDFELPDHPVEISEIYIDTTTCDKRLLEKCITSILHDPPKYGRRSVKVFYNGELDNLGDNLRNALQNNFEHIEKFRPNTQPGREFVFPFSVHSDSSSSSELKAVEPQSPSSVRGEPVEPQSPFDRLRANGERDSSTGLRANGERDPLTELKANGAGELLNKGGAQIVSPPSWRIVLKKLAGGITGGILGALLGGLSFGLLAVIVAEMEGSIVLESQVHPGTIVLAWIALATLIGIRKGIQKHQSFARGAIPLILIILLLAGIIIPNLLAAISSSKRSRTVADMRAMGTALGSYQVDRGFFPTSNGIKIPISDEKEDIGKRLCDEGYYCGSLQDSWQRPFIYVSDGTFYTLTSYGKDKKPDGKGAFNSDIIYVDGQFVAPSALVE